MDAEIKLIMILLNRKRMDEFETTECFYDRCSREEYLEAETNGDKLDKLLKLFEELYPEEYNSSLN